MSSWGKRDKNVLSVLFNFFLIVFLIFCSSPQFVSCCVAVLQNPEMPWELSMFYLFFLHFHLPPALEGDTAWFWTFIFGILKPKIWQGDSQLWSMPNLEGVFFLFIASERITGISTRGKSQNCLTLVIFFSLHIRRVQYIYFYRAEFLRFECKYLHLFFFSFFQKPHETVLIRLATNSLCLRHAWASVKLIHGFICLYFSNKQNIYVQ